MNLIEAAESLKLAGLNPLPLRENKAPKLAGGHPYLYKEVPEHLIEKLFDHVEVKKIGVACGDVSDGFYCLDFDCHDGEDIKAIFERFCEDPYIHSLILDKQVAVYQSPSGGYHLYFKSEVSQGGKELAYHKETNGVAIELRGNGQYMVTAPSKGYTKLYGCSLLDVERLDASQTEYLLNLARSLNQGRTITKAKANDATDSDRKWPEKWDDKTPRGKFNEENIEAVPQWLEDAGWKLMHIRESDQVQYWQRPGKPEDDRSISATYGAQRGMFYIFSTDGSIAPFEQGKGYAPFDVYINTVHKGDWKAALNEIDPKPEAPEKPHVPDPEGFPIDVFPQSVQELILELKNGADYYPDFVSIAVLSAYATCNGNKIKLRVKNDWAAPSIFWFIALGAPGTKKTHPIRTILKPLIHSDIESKKLYDSEMEEYEANEKKGNKPKFYQTLMQDYTIEALHLVHSINPKGICLYKDEIKGFLNDMNKYKAGGKGSDEQFWLESFNNGHYTVNRVSREPLMIENINIQLIGTIQPDVLEEVISQYSGNGLVDRFLFTKAETKVYPMSKKDVNPDVLENWNANIRSILKHPDMWYSDERDTKVLEMDNTCKEIYYAFEEWLTDIQNDENESAVIRGYISKLKSYHPRFVLILTLMDMFSDGLEAEVTPEIMHRAEKVTKYFLSTARAVFAESEENREIKQVMKFNGGKTKAEMIELLSKKGYRNTEIAKVCKCSKAYVSKVLTSLQPKK
jgi:hypothetical protein